MRFLIIGSGRMAIGVIHDLLDQKSTEEIYVTDMSSQALQNLEKRFADTRIQTHIIRADDLKNLKPLMQRAHGALSAAPYDYNVALTQCAIDNNCHFTDLGGNNEVVAQQFKLAEKAQAADVGIVPNCGLAPGMASVLTRHLINKFDAVEQLDIRVGGLPLNPQGPLKYQLVFSVHGLTNEYIESSRILEEGKIRSVPSMSGLETLHFPEPFGKLEAFYTSGGTSTLPETYEGKIKNLTYKTIRYPGHCQLFKTMVDLGFVDQKGLKLGSQHFTRRQIFEELLIEPLSYTSESAVLMRLTVRGSIEQKRKSMVYQLIDYDDRKNGLTSMMRTTAFPAAITLQMLVNGVITKRGVLKQETSVPDDIYMLELERRNINFTIEESDTNDA